MPAFMQGPALKRWADERADRVFGAIGHAPTSHDRAILSAHIETAYLQGGVDAHKDQIEYAEQLGVRK